MIGILVGSTSRRLVNRSQRTRPGGMGWSDGPACGRLAAAAVVAERRVW
jgi:hypothetical protein